MTAKRKTGLGRNLNMLLGDKVVTVNKSTSKSASSKPAQGPVIKSLPVEYLRPGKYQPRKHIAPEALQELSDSIKAQGIISPIVIRETAKNQYEIIAGERRWRAAQSAGLGEVPVIIREVDDQTCMALALIENIQREDLNALEEARALERLIDEFQLTHQEVSQSVGKSRASVSNLLRLTKLNIDVQQLLENGDLELGHAKVLLSLSGSNQSSAARQVVDQSLSVRQTEALVKQWQTGQASKAVTRTALDPDVARLQNKLGDKLGARVDIRYNDKGKGKLVIHYNSIDELDGILANMG